MIKVDVTRGGNPFHELLLKRYGVKGVPTVVFLDALGKEHAGLRLVDFLPPEPFLGHMSEPSVPERAVEAEVIVAFKGDHYLPGLDLVALVATYP
jgi:hypothetical protein